MSEIDVRRQLEILGHGAGDYASISWRDTAGWHSEVVPAAVIPAMVGAHADGCVFIGVNTVRPLGQGLRGGNNDVVRLCALVCDLDYAKLPAPACWSFIVTFSSMIGWPSMVVHSGGGLHVYWPLDREDAGELSNAAAAVLARRVGILASTVARRHGGRIDGVSDLARVLRAVGTRNTKYDPPIPVRGYEFGRGRPLFVDDVNGALDAYGVPEISEAEATAAVVSPPSIWPWMPDRVTAPCRYVATVAGGWATDPVRGSRHNWLVDQAVRLHEFHRRGCLGSLEQYEQYRAELRTAFFRRIAGSFPTPRDEEPPNEFNLVLAWSVQKAAIKGASAVISDSGGLHAHDQRAIEAAKTAALLGRQ